MNNPFDEAARLLADVGRRCDARGWVLGTSGNFSAVLGRAPLRIAITRSGTHKGDLTAADILEIADEGIVVRGTGVPSAEARLHLEIVCARNAGAVLHTHSVWSTFLSDRCADRGGVAIEGYEMLKGLSGVLTHEHREWIPVLDNDQNMARLGGVVRELLAGWPDCHAFLLRRHGLYTWGATLQDAIRHVEIVEFLLESVARAEYSGQPKSEEVAPWRS
ncbi:MAG: methylthioribulose 1-phosphate dehydratase [Acidobacteria bacterium]|nr:MAG: methylthioribulose 1-phosphate dehydratase [Acidobacteriota bacterium]